jgi:hypothetical protein
MRYGLLLAAAVLPHLLAAGSAAEDQFDLPPIEYSDSTPTDTVAKLQAKIDGDQVRLEYDEKLGYLPAALKALAVPVESQTLVFSQTSMQRHRISPRTPRAVYFNDDVYVGFCQAGNVLEITAIDPQLGAVFYTLDQEQADRPTFARQTDSCLTCHSTSRTENVPGLLVRSVFTSVSGQPILSEGSFDVDHRTPLKERWGGWYVTGEHGSQTHLGNRVLQDGESPRDAGNVDGQNVARLDGRFRVDRYLSPHSDIVALMVLEHQLLVHNRITQANFAARQALHYEAELNKALGEPLDTRLDSTTRRIQGAGDKLVEALLFVDEARLAEPIRGTSGFAEEFQARGPKDSAGRSLREFDLHDRMFKYPCSYLVYSDAFDQLPSAMKDYVWQRLWEVLEGRDASGKFWRLTADDRHAIREIIRETKQGLPSYWGAP